MTHQRENITLDKEEQHPCVILSLIHRHEGRTVTPHDNTNTPHRLADECKRTEAREVGGLTDDFSQRRRVEIQLRRQQLSANRREQVRIKQAF